MKKTSFRPLWSSSSKLIRHALFRFDECWRWFSEYESPHALSQGKSLVEFIKKFKWDFDLKKIDGVLSMKKGRVYLILEFSRDSRRQTYTLSNSRLVELIGFDQELCTWSDQLGEYEEQIFDYLVVKEFGENEDESKKIEYGFFAEHVVFSVGLAKPRGF